MVFDIHQHELVTGIRAPLILSPPPTSLPTLSLWVVTEYWIWVPCFMGQTCPGHLFYIR